MFVTTLLYGFSDFTIAKCNSTKLQIWKSFDVTREFDIVSLAWETYPNENIAYFIIESSTDGINFDSLTKIPARKSGGYFQYYDSPQPADSISYRITAFFIDNDYNSSEIKSIPFRFPIVFFENSKLIIMPQNIIYNITISDILGRLWLHRLIDTYTEIDISYLEEGLFFVLVNNKRQLTIYR
ncbi:MAG: hypothetical protein IPO21_18070 [Bacteroidales bacterium]|nr:hypothetical protein [Bacteroidales bacterium]